MGALQRAAPRLAFFNTLACVKRASNILPASCQSRGRRPAWEEAGKLTSDCGRGLPPKGRGDKGTQWRGTYSTSRGVARPARPARHSLCPVSGQQAEQGCQTGHCRRFRRVYGPPHIGKPQESTMSTLRVLLQRVRVLERCMQAHAPAVCKLRQTYSSRSSACLSRSHGHPLAAQAAAEFDAAGPAQQLQLPSHCSGCGVRLQSADQDAPG